MPGIDLKVIVAVGMVLLFPTSIFIFFKTMYHFWFVVNGVRGGKTLVVSLLGPFALFVPSLFDEKAQPHLRLLNIWLPLCAVSFGGLFLLQWLASEAQ